MVLFNKKRNRMIETTKEVAERMSTRIMEIIFKDGAKLQQERSYSEDDIKLAFNEGYDVCRYVTDNTDEAKECFNEWFEQFKKK
jgi:hypothetical protein